MNKTEFISEMDKIQNHTIHECPNSGTLGQYMFTLKIYDKNKPSSWDSYFHTNYVMHSKWDMANYQIYLERCERLRDKIYRWFYEYVEENISYGVPTPSYYETCFKTRKKNRTEEPKHIPFPKSH